ncbi:MAG: protein translocase subunit SecD [Propionibacteriaceae bacterium]|jgi:preprotein translocase subunit SecD|nr:protein translocase subunit SecD [Propionibacteriaceae bacterium]
MAATAPRRRRPAVTIITFLVILVILVAIMAFSKTWTPKLGLDLRGGTTITLTASNTNGGGTVDQTSLEQARTIIEQRVNSLGVGEATVTTTGNNQIQVSVPNVQGDDLVSMVGQTAQLEFRRVQKVEQATSYPQDMATGLPTVPTSTDTRPTEPTTTLPTDTQGRLDLLKTQLGWTPSDQDTTDFTDFQCNDVMPQVWDQPFFACTRDDVAQSSGAAYKYLLGPRILEGNLVTSAAAGIPQNELNWIVTLNFNTLGGDLFGEATSEITGATSPTDQFAIVLDGKVISAPKVNEAIPNGSAQISGSFNQTSATNLANVLKYGALPLNFDLSNVETVSATLGGDQLTAGLIAGGIGLLLVVIYSLVYYRGLGVVVFTSLLMAGGTVYTLVVLLGQSIGFALSLPGLAGAIVAIGVTADSFIIFFERVRDEAREGRSIRTAVETGWDKARRTIVVADLVSLLSAVILYILSIGTIKGFAFTLGLTTVVDLLLIFFFTKPLVSLLVRTKFFGTGRRGSGFEAEHLGISAARRPRPRALATVKEA